MPDSTKGHEVAIYKLWQLVKMAQEAVLSDSVIKYQEKEIQKGLAYQLSSDSLLETRVKEIKAYQAEAAKNYALYMTQIVLTKAVGKEKRKWVIIAISAILVLLIETTLVITN